MNDKCTNCGERDATHDGYCGPCSVELAREHACQMWDKPPGRGWSDTQTAEWIEEHNTDDD